MLAGPCPSPVTRLCKSAAGAAAGTELGLPIAAQLCGCVPRTLSLDSTGIQELAWSVYPRTVFDAKQAQALAALSNVNLVQWPAGTGEMHQKPGAALVVRGPHSQPVC